MADVAIIHAADKGTAAARLADAIAGAGFAVNAVEIEDPAGLADSVEGSAADATILIWSRPLVSHALHSGELTRIRQLRGLIEVSADGITPPSRGDEARVVSISGWRGQPFHPGWQRIHLELKRLCGARKPLSDASSQPAGPKNPLPQRAAPVAPSGGARPRARRMAIGGGVALLLAAAAGAASWFGRGAPDSPPGQELREARGAASIAEAPRPDLRTEPEAPEAPATAPPVQNASPLPSPERPAAAEARPDAIPAGPTLRAAPAAPAVRPKPRPAPRAEPAKKYSRKNSKVMREFCERSGRSTPQCRTFLRSVRGTGARD